MKPPKTRGDCVDAPRPCPWGGCRYWLPLQRMVDAGKKTERETNCALDIADEGHHTLEEISTVLGVTRERVRQIEAIALNKLKQIADMGWIEQLGEMDR